MKKLMILGASILQLPAIKKAREMGLDVIAVDMNPNAIGFEEKGIIREIISTIDTDKILVAAKKHKINGIMTLASDMPMRSVAAVAKAMGLIGIDEQTALNTTNKAVMRQCLKDHNVPIPDFYKVSTINEYYTAVDVFKDNNINFIVKPADNSGSRGVYLVSDIKNEKAVYEAYKYSKTYSRNGDIVIEEYMEGPEVSVETLSVDKICNVIQITDKLTTGSPFFVEMGHNEPSLLPKHIKERVADVAKAAVNAVGIENGPSHTEIKVTKSGPKIVELGARLGGDNITTHLVPMSTGIDMVECCIKIALGEVPDLSKKHNKGSAIRYIKTDSVGKISKVSGIESALNIDGVKQVSIVCAIGDNIGVIKNSVDRIGFVIAQADTPQAAIGSCEEAMKKIKIEVGK